MKSSHGGYPVRRALERERITDLHALSSYSERKILQLHCVGPTTMPKLDSADSMETSQNSRAARHHPTPPYFA
ncbi:MAG TPA: hypothetical protein DIW48_12565 [Sphaerochaeta sp.]|nr:hypothetical protein [Sphaerochaeta sp.]HCS37478.1 hypothetical protein [Sphaerochaeta sp.]